MTDKTEAPEKLAYTIEEVLARLPFSRASLYRCAKRGLLTIRKAGNRSFITAKELDAFLDSAPSHSDYAKQRRTAASG